MAAAVGDDAKPAVETPRLVVLGASNVARGLRTIVGTARREFAGPVDFFLAYAHGRSYGVPSSIGWWTYPPLLDCDLWDALKAGTEPPTYSIITDIGNDIVYGVAPEQIVSWVREAYLRLRDHSDRIVITQLPLESVLRVDPLRFRVFRAILFPKCRMNLEEVLRRSRRLGSLLKQLSEESQIEMLHPRLEWYGLDPIHIRHVQKASAWRHLIGSVVSADTRHPKASNSLKTPRFPHVRPARWQSRGRPRNASQPAVRLPDGSRLWRF